MKKVNLKVIFIPLACLAVVVLVVMIFAIHKNSDDLGSKEPNSGNKEHIPINAYNDTLSRGEGGNNTSKNTNQAALPKNRAIDDLSDKTLVRFSTEDSRDNFIIQNGLSINNLTNIEQIGVYIVNAKNLRQTEGSEIFTTRKYTAMLTPQDSLYSQQWHLSRVGAPTTWNNTTGNDTTVVAIVDTGFALTHQDLDSKWAINNGEKGATNNEGQTPNCTSRSLILDKSCNNLDDDSDGYIDNYVGWDFVTDSNSPRVGQQNPLAPSAFHGTFVSGLVAAETNNSQGVSGVSWNAQLLPVQVLGDDGSGNTLSVALGINYATMHGAKVINLSLGADGDDPLVAEQIQNAVDNGVTVIAASGNDGLSQISYPANYPNVIAVGASDASDNRANFSNYGANLALLATGGSSMCSTSWKVTQPTSYYSCGNIGTSYAAPIVTGTVALILAQNSKLTPKQVKTALISTATKVPGMAGQNFTYQYGYGRLDIYNALKSISLPAPYSNVVNTHNISLSASSDILKPTMNTTCESYFTSSSCSIRVINVVTNKIIDLTQSNTPTSSLNLYWNASTAGLTPGTWLVQARTSLFGQYSMVSEESLVVSP